MNHEDRLRAGLADLAEEAGWTDLHDRVQAASRRLGWRRRIATSVAAVAVILAAVPVALTVRASFAGAPRIGSSTEPSASVTPSGSDTGPPRSAPASSATGCPVTAATLYAALAGAYVAGETFGQPTRLTDVTCYGRYATAYPDPRVGSLRILFGYTLPDGTWIPLNAGTTGLCDSYVLDAETSSHLPGC